MGTENEDSLRTTLGEYSPSGFFTRTWFSPEDIRLADPAGPSYEQNWHIWSTLLHEWFHHLQIIGTTYGRFHYDITLTAGACISRALRQLFEVHDLGELRRPVLLDLCRLSDTIDQDPIMLGSRAAAIRSALFGNDQYVSAAIPTWIAPPLSTSSPHIEVAGNSYVMGGRHILEGHARSNETVYLAWTLSQKTFCEAMDQMGDLDPYQLAEAHLRTRAGLNDEILLRLLCDVAMNPEWLERSERIAWEDFHPGWRFVRMVDALVEDLPLRRLTPSETDWDKLDDYTALHHALLARFGWKRPEHILPATTGDFPWFTSAVLGLRTEVPLAFAMLTENMKIMQALSPLSFDTYIPPNLDSELSKTLSPTEEFEARRYMAVIFDRTIHEMLTKRYLTCPIHGASILSPTGCPSPCYFLGFFRSTFGITADQFLSIPLSDQDEGT